MPISPARKQLEYRSTQNYRNLLGLKWILIIDEAQKIQEVGSILNKIFDLLRLIAFQIDSEVSYNELGRQLSMSKNTVEKYLDLLSKVFILHSVSAFSRNLRKEKVKGKRWYFYDNGIRNILIGNMNPIELRNDVGALWENYIISERINLQSNRRMLVYNFFWRTYDQQEIYWVEERDGKLYAYEFKWNPTKKAKQLIAWENAYPESEFQVIDGKNYAGWIKDGLVNSNMHLWRNLVKVLLLFLYSRYITLA